MRKCEYTLTNIFPKESIFGIHDKKINHRGHRGAQRMETRVPLCPLWFVYIPYCKSNKKMLYIIIPISIIPIGITPKKAIKPSNIRNLAILR